MKANAPEKIYVDSKAVGDNISTTVHTKRQDYPTCTEYTRTDAFIEKAATWFANRYQSNGSYLCANDIDDFLKYMEGIIKIEKGE